MYRKLPHKRKTLISNDEVIAMIPGDTNVDPIHIQESIQIAEERFIVFGICQDLYYDFRDQKNVVITDINKEFVEDSINEDNPAEGDTAAVVLKVGDIVNAIEFVTNTNYVDLWHEHLQKLIAECVMYQASPTNYSRFTSSGEMENNPKSITNEGANTASVELATMKWKLDKMMMDRISPLIAGMEAWLYKNRNYFPYYNCQNWFGKNTPDGVALNRKTGWIPGVYDNKIGCYNPKDQIWSL